MTISMRAGVLALAAALSLCAGGPALAQSDSSLEEAKPRISVPVNTHDFGEVWEGEKVTYVFTVRNTGDAELHILDAKGS